MVAFVAWRLGARIRWKLDCGRSSVIVERGPWHRSNPKIHATPEDASMVDIGKPAPDFSLMDQNGKKVTLSKLKGSPVVLYFYPKDDTPGCTKEACSFRDDTAVFKKKGALILGVSPDDTESHAKFAKKFELPFSLLADVGNKICTEYGVWKEKNMYGRKYMGVERTTFVIDAKGVVRQIFPKVKVDGHSAAVLEALDRCQ
jgi:peroxiredoxin Q/BCP